MTTTQLTSLQDMARHLLDAIEQGGNICLEITGRDTETGALLQLILELHEAASRRQVAVVVTQQDAATIRLSVPGRP